MAGDFLSISFGGPGLPPRLRPHGGHVVGGGRVIRGAVGVGVRWRGRGGPPRQGRVGRVGGGGLWGLVVTVLGHPSGSVVLTVLEARD